MQYNVLIIDDMENKMIDVSWGEIVGAITVILPIVILVLMAKFKKKSGPE